MLGKGFVFTVFKLSQTLYDKKTLYPEFFVRLRENETKTGSSELFKRGGSPSTYARSTIS